MTQEELKKQIANVTKQTICTLKSKLHFDKLTPELLQTIVWNTRKSNFHDLYNHEIDVLVYYNGYFNNISEELIDRACLFLEDMQEGERFGYYMQRDIIEHTLSMVGHYDDPFENGDEYDRFYDDLQLSLIEDDCFKDEDALEYDRLMAA